MFFVVTTPVEASQTEKPIKLVGVTLGPLALTAPSGSYPKLSILHASERNCINK
jgi:hypothetical protein